MHARIGTFQVSPEKLEQVESLFQQEVIPRFSEHKGFVGYTAYVDRERGRFVGISRWESHEDLDASAGAALAARNATAEIGAETIGEPQILQMAFDARPSTSSSGVPPRPAESVVQAQLDAYNAKDIEALLATYAPEAQHFTLHGELLAQGHEQLRPRFLTRFSEPDLHAKLLSRMVVGMVVGNVVTDAELITRNFPEGVGTLEMLCIYEVADGRIQRASFALGEKRLLVTP